MKAVRRNACAKRPHAGQGPHLLARPRHIHHVLHPADDGPHGAARGIESVPHSFFLLLCWLLLWRWWLLIRLTHRVRPLRHSLGHSSKYNPYWLEDPYTILT